MRTRKIETPNNKEQPSKELIGEHEVFINNLCGDAPYPLFVIGPDTSIRYVNPAFVELTGFTLKELIGRKPPYPWWCGDINKKTTELKSVVLSGESRIERRNVKKNGEHFWVQVSGKPVLINGEVKYFLSNWVDITKRKKTEQQLSKLNKDLRSLTAHLDSIREEERGNISRMIHDELGQALTALKMDVCWIRKSLDGDKHSVMDTTDNMLKLIDATFKKVRWISTVLRPIWLDDLGLADTFKMAGRRIP
jgi:PAS domain S-box-containing protein